MLLLSLVCSYFPWIYCGVFLLSLDLLWCVLTFPESTVECSYFPWIYCGVFLLSLNLLWSVLTFPGSTVECSYFPWCVLTFPGSTVGCSYFPWIYCGVFLLSLDLCSYSSHLILVTKLGLILYCTCVGVGVCGVWECVV